jgi:hypothetical protein
MNVTWEPSKSGNPGSVFYVQYRKDGKTTNLKTTFCRVHTLDTVPGKNDHSWKPLSLKCRDATCPVFTGNPVFSSQKNVSEFFVC